MLIQDLIISWGRNNRYRRESRFGLIPRKESTATSDLGLDGEALQILQEGLDEVLLIPANVGDIIEPIMAFIPQNNNIPLPIPGQPLPWDNQPGGDPELPVPPNEFKEWMDERIFGRVRNEVESSTGGQHPHGDPDATKHGLSRHRVCFTIHDAEWVAQNKDVPPEEDTYANAFGIGSDFWNRLPDEAKINPDTGDTWTEEEWVSHLISTSGEPLSDRFGPHLQIGAKGKGWEVCECCNCCPPIACDAYWYWERLEQTVAGTWEVQTWPMCQLPVPGPMCDFPLDERIIFPQDLLQRDGWRLADLFQAGDILPGPIVFRGVDDKGIIDRAKMMIDGPTGVLDRLPSMPLGGKIQGEDVKDEFFNNPDINIDEASKRMRDLQVLWNKYNSSFSNIYIDLDFSRPDLELLGDFNNLDAPINRQNTPLIAESGLRMILWPAGRKEVNKFIKPFAGLVLKYMPENPNIVFRRLWNQEITLNLMDPEGAQQMENILRVARQILEIMDWAGLIREGPGDEFEPRREGQEIDEIMELLRADWNAHFARNGMDNIPANTPVIETMHHDGKYVVRADFDAGFGGTMFPDVHNGPHRCFYVTDPVWVATWPEVNPAVDILSMSDDRDKLYVQDLEVGDIGNGWGVCAGCPCPDDSDKFKPLNRGELKKNLNYAERWLKAAPRALIPQGEAGDPGEPGEPGAPGEIEGEEVFMEIKKAAGRVRQVKEQPNFPTPFGAPNVPEPKNPKEARKELDKALKQDPVAAKEAIKRIQRLVPDEMNAFLKRAENKKLNP